MNDINFLRAELFEQLKKLKTTDMTELAKEIERSKCVVAVSETIIDSARVQNEFLAISGGKDNNFLSDVKTLELPQ